VPIPNLQISDSVGAATYHSCVTEQTTGTSFMAYLSPAVPMQLDSVIFALLPGTGIPRTLGARGVTTGDDRPAEPVLMVGYDFPEQTAAAVSKTVQETRDVDAFLRDAVPVGRVTRDSRTNPSDPPDVLAHIDGSEFGIEATQFVPPDSELDKSNSIVGRWMAFERFRDKVLEQDPYTLSQHRGLLTVMHFGRSSASPNQRLPPKPANLGSAIAALRTAQPIVRDGSAAAAPEHESDVIQWSSDRSIFFAWTELPFWYASPFRNQMGFELALGYHATITRSDLRAELRRVISDHDNRKRKHSSSLSTRPCGPGCSSQSTGQSPR